MRELVSKGADPLLQREAQQRQDNIIGRAMSRTESASREASPRMDGPDIFGSSEREKRQFESEFGKNLRHGRITIFTTTHAWLETTCHAGLSFHQRGIQKNCCLKSIRSRGADFCTGFFRADLSRY